MTPNEKKDIIEYFNYKDALTGIDLDMDNLIIVNIFPEIIKETKSIYGKIVCNKDNDDYILTDEYLLSVYQKQDCFDSDRFINITEWMSKDNTLSYMSKYKYVEKNQLKYIDTFDENDSMQTYNVMSKNNKRIKLFYSNKYNREQFCSQIYDIAILPNEQHLLDNWLGDSKSASSTSRFLDRCADYILLGELDYKKNIKYKEAEIPVSNISYDFMEIFESLGGDNNSNFNIEHRYKYKNDIEEEILGKKKNNVIRKRKSKSRLQKICEICDCPAFERNELVCLSNREVYGIMTVFENSDENETWLNKDAKNIFGKKIYDTDIVYYAGKPGVINPNDPYLLEWHYVDSHGEFDFNAKKFQVDIGNHVQYTDISKTNKKQKHDYWSMDAILCGFQYNKYFFWDMNILRLEHIREIKEEEKLC